jgi:hypothetical protein
LSSLLSIFGVTIAYVLRTADVLQRFRAFEIKKLTLLFLTFDITVSMQQLPCNGRIEDNTKWSFAVNNYLIIYWKIAVHLAIVENNLSQCWRICRFRPTIASLFILPRYIIVLQAISKISVPNYSLMFFFQLSSPDKPLFSTHIFLVHSQQPYCRSILPKRRHYQVGDKFLFCIKGHWDGE